MSRDVVVDCGTLALVVCVDVYELGRVCRPRNTSLSYQLRIRVTCHIDFAYYFYYYYYPIFFSQ